MRSRKFLNMKINNQIMEKKNLEIKSMISESLLKMDLDAIQTI